MFSHCLHSIIIIILFFFLLFGTCYFFYKIFKIIINLFLYLALDNANWGLFITCILNIFIYYMPSVKSHNGPWLLFVSESGYGKRVPLSFFRMSSLNRVGLIGYKVFFPFVAMPILTTINCSFENCCLSRLCFSFLPRIAWLLYLS